jgi:hypothetical protein
MILLIDVKYSVPHQQDNTMATATATATATRTRTKKTKTNTKTKTKTNTDADNEEEEIIPIPRLPVRGPKELKKRIQEYVTLVNQMKNEFERSLNTPDARVDYAPICVPLHEFHASQCAVKHRDFIRKVGSECQTLYIPDNNVNSTLAALEKFRTMLVTNKRHRKTAHKGNRRVSTAIQASLHKGDEGELEQPMNSFSVDLMKMDAEAKQHHRTMSRNILEEVNRNLFQLRTQFILALQAALDDSIGQIIQHAEKTREAIERIRRLALLEYCASRWFHAQKDEMDSNEYVVGIHETSADGGSGGKYELKVHTFQDREEIFVATYDVNDEFVDQVLTEESITEFAWEEQTLAADKEDARQRYANYEREQTQYYADQAKAAAAWHAQFDIADGRAAACAIEMMEDIDNDSDYDPDTHWG